MPDDTPPIPEGTGDPIQPALATAGAAEETEHDEPLDQLSPYFRESVLAPEGGETPSTWLWVSLFGVVFFSVYYLGANVGDFSPYPWLRHPAETASVAAAAPVAVDGAQVYQTKCQACHQAGGEGVPGSFPPLAGSELVQGDKGVVIRVLLHGLNGPVEVAGATYNGNMPPWAMLSDEEIAAVTTHERSSWGNDAEPITADEVAALREALAGRAQPWTAEELAQPENQGLPATASGDAAAPDSAASPAD